MTDQQAAKLIAECEALRAECSSLRAENAALKDQLQLQKDINAELIKRIYGASSEPSGAR